MKAISLHQPWASLIALGLKRVETRGKRTAYRGPILIHAAKKWTPEQAGILAAFSFELDRADLVEACSPRGRVVAVARLVDVRPMVWSGQPHQTGAIFIDEQTPQERAAGDWRVGRFAWVLDDVRPIEPPLIALRGQQAAPFTVAEDDVGPAAWARLEALTRA